MSKTIFVIYKIYWPGKGYYFGQSKGFGKRRNRHLREMKDGTHHNKNLIRMYQRHGEPKIKIYRFVDTGEELELLESRILSEHKDNKRNLNIHHR